MKRFVYFLRHYKLLSLAIAAGVAAGILEITGQHTAAHWVLGVVSLVEVLPLLAGMWQDIRSGKYGIDILAATAIVVSVLLHEYWAAIIVVIMLTGGESLERYAERRAHSELDALLTRAPQVAHVLRGRKIVDVKASEVQASDKIVIRPGEVVPVDALILEGTANFDESSLTGESLPQSKSAGDQILSGSINVDGALTAQAQHTAADSQYEQIIRLVRSAAGSQAPFVRLADRYSIPFTISAYIIAAAAWVWSGQSIRFLEVIIVATPCPLLLAAPIALISGMSRASKYGIIIKTGSALEKLSEARTFAFDKTGTLTRGVAEVQNVVAFSPFKQQEVLSFAASLEQNSNHVLAHAVVAAAQTKRVKLAKAKHVKEFSGRGVEAHIGGKDIIVGRLSLLEERDVSLPREFKRTKLQQTAAFVAVNGKLAGYITFEDELRPEAKTTVKSLARFGVVRSLMITGDNAATAQTIAKRLKITDVVADALPGDKLRAIEHIKERPLVFVGDGVNDAPVLTAADVGIALGARGSTAASESADIVIMQDDLSYVTRALTVAQQTFRIATQSIFVGIGLSVILMFIFATGKFPPVAGAIVQEVVDVVVIFNALRAHSAKYISGTN